MPQYVFSLNRVGKIVPPKKQILKDISLSFFPPLTVLSLPFLSVTVILLSPLFLTSVSLV